MVQSIDRPDVNGIPPKMADIADKAKAATNILPWMVIDVNDNIMSSITIRATVESKEHWPRGIMHNARYVIISITPMDGKRYYDPADPKVTLSLTSSNVKTKLRKFTGTVDKVIAKLKNYLETVKAETPDNPV